MKNKDTHSLMKAYRLKHKPTGLYWVKKGAGRLSDKGSVYTSNNHAFSGLGPEHEMGLNIFNDKLIHKYWDVFSKVGILKKHPRTVWDMNKGCLVETGGHYYTWHMVTKVSDFEKEYVTLVPETPEPSVIQDNKEIIDEVTRVLVERVTRACWDQMFSISKDMTPYEDLLKRVKNQLNIG